jgi:hypothetical protein
MRNRSSIGGDKPPKGAPGGAPQPSGRQDVGTISVEELQVINRRCTICDWEAQLIERGFGEDPLCPWCYGPTERTSVVGLVMPEAVQPGQKNPYAASLGRLGGLKGGPARALKLTAKQRRDIATKAARARWGAKPKPARAKTLKTPKKK